MYKVTKEVLELWDMYDQDCGLLDERWAKEEDRTKFTKEVLTALSSYWNLLHEIRVSAYSDELRAKTQARLDEVESLIEPYVREVLMRRLLDN